MPINHFLRTAVLMAVFTSALWLLVSSATVPEGCNCLHTRCNCTASSISLVTGKLPNTTTSLNFTLEVSPNESYNISLKDAHLKRFQTLTELFINVPYAGSSVARASLSGLEDPNTFVGLAQLKRLQLNVIVTGSKVINESVFSPLSSLEDLDLSYTQKINFKHLKGVFKKMSTNSLRKLILRGVQCYATNQGFTTNLDLSQLLEPFEKMRLEVVDISRNALMHLTPGIFRHRHLKEFYVHENFVVMSGLYMEMFFHPTLEIGVGDYQGCPTGNQYKPKMYHDYVDLLNKWDRDSESFIEHAARYRPKTLQEIARDPAQTFTPKVENFAKGNYDNRKKEVLSFQMFSNSVSKMRQLESSGTALCEWLKETPELKKWMEGISCEDFPDIKREAADPEMDCLYKPFLIPMAPNLREFHVAHFYYYIDALYTVPFGSYCFGENNVTVVDLSHLGNIGKLYNADEIRLKGLRKLEVLNLDGCQLSLSTFDFLSYFPSLRVWKNSGNVLHLEKDVRFELFANNSNLQEIILSRNKIQQIPEGEFRKLDRLQILDLSHNELQEANFDLPTSGNLRSLILTNNMLQTLPVRMRQQLNNIAMVNNFSIQVDLSLNHLSCACEDMDFVKWMKKTRVYFKDKKDYLCQGSPTKQNRIIDIDTKKMTIDCIPAYVKIISASVGATLGLVALILFAYILHSKRFAIMHWKYTKFVRPKLQYDDINLYAYDAFIVYNSEDKWWSHHTLLAEMEERRHLKLCIYLRDFPAGGAYADVIDEAMDSSRKTVLILTPNFFDSNWCQHEMSMTHNRLVADGLDLVEIVILEDFSSDCMTSTLAQLMQLKPPIRWTDHRDGQKLFWNKLEDAIRSPRRYPNLE